MHQQNITHMLKRLQFFLALIVIISALKMPEVKRQSRMLHASSQPDNEAPVCLNHILRLVFSGGGAQGVMYPGAYAALEHMGLLKDVQQVAASSMGTLPALCVALGIKNQQFREAFDAFDFEALLGEPIGFSFKKVPGSLFFSKTGKPLENWVREFILKSVNDFLETTDVEQDQALRALKLKLNATDVAFTFSDLNILHQRFPKKFKQLLVTAITYPDGQFIVFNAKHHPEVDIVKAIRASIALPIVLVPGRVQDKLHMDGGYYDNTPANYFDLDKKGRFIPNQKQDQTLVFAFGEGVRDEFNPVYQALHGTEYYQFGAEKIPTLYHPSLIERIQRDYLPCWLVGLRMPCSSIQKKRETYQRLWSDYPTRTVELRVGKLKTTDFTAARRDARVMWAFAYLDTLLFILTYLLYDEETLNEEQVANCIVLGFIQAYQQVLQTTAQNITGNPLIEYQTSHAKEPIRVLKHIKKEVEFSPDTVEAVVLSRSVEKYDGCLTNEELTQEIKRITSMRYRFLYRHPDKKNDNYSENN